MFTKRSVYKNRVEGKDQESISRDIYKTRPFEIYMYIENILQIGISERRIIYT